MKISCGVDIIEIDRVKESIEQLGNMVHQLVAGKRKRG